MGGSDASDRAIIEAINKMTGQHKLSPVYYVDAIVNSVNVDKRICNCTAIGGQTEYELPNVKLMPVVDDGILIEPVLNSIVKVIFSQTVEPFICQYSEIENITIDAKTKIKFNDGSFGGLTKTKELKTQLNKLTKRVDGVINALNNASPDSSTGTFKSTLTPLLQQITDKEDFSKIENTKIEHGI
ncbi:MAG: hypothetical protein WC886_06230 [Saccharofermentanaceae bacterium]|jgi:hypothetical protein